MNTNNKPKPPKYHTRYLLPDGDKITLSCKDGSCIGDFLETNPEAVIIDRYNIIFEDIKVAAQNIQYRKPVLTCKHNFSI